MDTVAVAKTQILSDSTSIAKNLMTFVETNIILFIALFFIFLIIGITYTGSWILVDLIKIKLKKIANKIKSIFSKDPKNEDQKTHHGMPDINTVNLFNIINEDLAVLRSEIDADRAFIVEFHNGQVFASKAPRWKTSKTYEKVRNGVSFEAFNMQNLEVTLQWTDFLKVLYTKGHEKLPPGFTVIRQNPECKHSTNCTAPRRTYLLNVSQMDKNMGPTRTLLERQHVYYQILAPILDSKLDLIGYVGADYCAENDINEIILNKNFQPCKICQFASRLSSMWEDDLEQKTNMMLKQKDFWHNLRVVNSSRQ